MRKDVEKALSRKLFDDVGLTTSWHTVN